MDGMWLWHDFSSPPNGIPSKSDSDRLTTGVSQPASRWVLRVGCLVLLSTHRAGGPRRWTRGGFRKDMDGSWSIHSRNLTNWYQEVCYVFQGSYSYLFQKNHVGYPAVSFRGVYFDATLNYTATCWYLLLLLMMMMVVVIGYQSWNWQSCCCF